MEKFENVFIIKNTTYSTHYDEVHSEVDIEDVGHKEHDEAVKYLTDKGLTDKGNGVFAQEWGRDHSEIVMVRVKTS